MVPDSREVRLDPLLLRTEEHAENTPSEAQSSSRILAGKSEDDFGTEQDIEAIASFEVEPDVEASPPYRQFAAKVAVTVTCFLVLTIFLEVYAKEAVHEYSAKLMHLIGLPGLFVAVLVGDGLPQPLPYVPLIYVAVKAAVPREVVFAVCAIGSYCAALAGYGAGFSLMKVECYQQALHKLSSAQPWLPDLMQRRGAVGVAIAALMPIPLAVATWTAGSFRVNFPQFLVAAAFRMPKILIFVLLSGGPPGPPPGPPPARAGVAI